MTDGETGAAEPPAMTSVQRYSAFSRWQQNTIIGLAAVGGWFSTVSSFIYFPAIPFLASDLGVSIGNVNLTVTSYLIMAGVFPAIMGDAADRFGRRPVLLLGMLVYLAANIGLALQSNFALLFVFRMIQSAGISGTFSITYGVLSDLFTPAERGGYSGTVSFFLLTPPSLGPILSGLLLLRWTWRYIFWLLAAMSALSLLGMALFLPETARSIVGNGSIPAKGINKALVPTIPPKGNQGIRCSSLALPPPRRESRKPPNPLAALKLLRIPSTVIMLVAYGINYAVSSCLQASLSTLFVDIYHVSGLVASLVYLPFGVAVCLSAFTTGRLLDFDYKRTTKEPGIIVEKGKATDLSNFPIERARLRTVVFSIALSALLVMGYGWTMQARLPMAVPLVLQFFIGLATQVIFVALNTLLVDLHPECPSTAQAACNFVRCEMAAACLAGLDPLIRKVGPGWTFVLFGFALVVEFLMILLLLLKGLKWRRRSPNE